MSETKRRHELVTVPGYYECGEAMKAIYTARVGVKLTSVIELADMVYGCFDEDYSDPNALFIKL